VTPGTLNRGTLKVSRFNASLLTRVVAVPDACKQGFVWREARPTDHVCVTPEVRDETAADNRRAAGRREPGGGPDICRAGYVWRDAFSGDKVCVTKETRQQARADNAMANERRVSPP